MTSSYNRPLDLSIFLDDRSREVPLNWCIYDIAKCCSTYVTVYFHNLLNTVWLHEWRGNSFFNSKNNTFWCLYTNCSWSKLKTQNLIISKKLYINCIDWNSVKSGAMFVLRFKKHLTSLQQFFWFSFLPCGENTIKLENNNAINVKLQGVGAHYMF